MDKSMTLLERTARAIDEAYLGYSIRLTKLVDEEAEYTAIIEGESPRIFPDHAEASEWVEGFRKNARARAALTIIIPEILEMAAKVAESRAAIADRLIEDEGVTDARVAASMMSKIIAQEIRSLTTDMGEGVEEKG